MCRKHSRQRGIVTTVVDGGAKLVLRGEYEIVLLVTNFRHLRKNGSCVLVHTFCGFCLFIDC